MEAIKATRQNFDYVEQMVLRTAPWAADFKSTFESNLANGEWTIVYVIFRGTGDRTKSFYYSMTESKFNETFTFDYSSPWSLTPITAK